MKTFDWIKKNTHSIEGKSVAVSGSTGGIGKELCLHFASLGAKRIISLNRSEKRTLALERKLKDEFPMS